MITTDLTPRTIELDVRGMTCASCAARIEKKLNRMDGVQASVNYATEKATARVDAAVGADALITTIRQTGYDASLPTPARRDVHPDILALRTRVISSAALSLPVVALSMITGLQFAGWPWLAFALTLPVVLWAAWPFHRATAVNLRHGAATMDTLITLGTAAATGWSAYALIVGGQTYLEAAVAIPTFLLLGRYLEARAKRRSGAAVRALMELAPARVSLLRQGSETVVDVAELRVGDQFVVRPGERLATDGVVVTGHTAVDVAMISGEPVPVEVGPGDAVVGGCINTYGRLVVEATRVGDDTKLAQIAILVAAAQTGKAQVQRLADRISAIFVPVVIGLAALTLLFWLGRGAGAAFAVAAAVAVLIIACPCALGLAIPTALMVGTGRGAQRGILIKGPEVLESTRRIDTVVLDKTGTLTEGRMAVVEIIAGATTSETEVIRIAGAAESGSEHPVARAITAYAGAAGPLPEATGLINRPGRGLVATLDHRRVVVGGPGLLHDEELIIDSDLQQALADQRELGRTAVLIGWDGAARGVIAVADTIKPTSAEAVRRLRRLGLRPVLLTGDHQTAARSVAAAVGIEEVIADVLPSEKVTEIRRLQDSGARVAMIGDGVNDAAALAQADLGIALGTGTDAAIEASDLTLVRGDLRVAADAIRLSRATLRTIKVNLFWAFAYNVAAIPLAAAGLLDPVFAAAAMALSSLFVVTNSLRLRRFS